MAADNKTIVAQIDMVLAQGDTLAQEKSRDTFSEVITLYSAAIERLAPPGSQYARELEKQKQKYHPEHLLFSPQYRRDTIDGVAGVLRALRQDYDAGRMQSFRELVHSDLFSDFLSMAEYLLTDENLKDPAAVLAGSVLEEHLRKLCDQHTIPTTMADSSGKQSPKKLDTMNADLARQTVYGKNEQKQVTAWAGIRNDAAHGHFGNYQHQQVALMLQGIRDFINRYPA